MLDMFWRGDRLVAAAVSTLRFVCVCECGVRVIAYVLHFINHRPLVIPVPLVSTHLA